MVTFIMAKKKQESTSPVPSFSDLEMQARKALVTWTNKVDEFKNMSLDEIYNLYLQTLEAEQRLHPAKPEIELHTRALRKFRLQYKQKKAGGGSVECTGIFWGYKGSFDQMAKRLTDIFNKAKLNPLAAAKEGLIKAHEEEKNGVTKLIVDKDKEGNYIPIDNLREYKFFTDDDGNPVANKRFGKELPKHQYSALWFGMFSVDGGDPEIGFYQIRGPDARKGIVQIPMNVPVKFYAYGVDKDRGTGLLLISGFKTKFEIISQRMPTLHEAVKNGYLTQYIKHLSEIPEFFGSNKNVFNAFFVATVNVTKKSMEKSSNGTYRIVVEDDSIAYVDPDSDIKYIQLTGFVPDCFEDAYGQFGEYSSLDIIANCRIDFKKDSSGKLVYDSDKNKVLDDPVLSIWGFDIDPEFLEKPRVVEQIEGNEFVSVPDVTMTTEKLLEDDEEVTSIPETSDDEEDDFFDSEVEKPVVVDDDSIDDVDDMIDVELDNGE